MCVRDPGGHVGWRSQEVGATIMGVGEVSEATLLYHLRLFPGFCPVPLFVGDLVS